MAHTTCGGFGDARPGGDDAIGGFTEEIVKTVRSHGHDVDGVRAVSYKKQVVAGTNWDVLCEGTKSGTAIIRCVVRVFEALPAPGSHDRKKSLKNVSDIVLCAKA